ncbi:hypothetical protein HMPREF9946_02499 [Acetobacteraceae bacterium AT-5844]|nr:hypothetical protein HMPREF9946_02499 [Acetobacteraceae bacterium AT-5844]
MLRGFQDYGDTGRGRGVPGTRRRTPLTASHGYKSAGTRRHSPTSAAWLYACGSRVNFPPDGLRIGREPMPRLSVLSACDFGQNAPPKAMAGAARSSRAASCCASSCQLSARCFWVGLTKCVDPGAISRYPMLRRAE